MIPVELTDSASGSHKPHGRAHTLIHRLPLHLKLPKPTMAWKEIAATPAHRTYLLLASFLVLYTLFTSFIRNRLHLSEPPIALLFGILLGPKGLGWVVPNSCDTQGCVDQQVGSAQGWGWGDDVIQEITRVVVGIQVFTIGVSMPKHYFSKNWPSIAVLLGKGHPVYRADGGQALTKLNRAGHGSRLANLWITCACCVSA